MLLPAAPILIAMFIAFTSDAFAPPVAFRAEDFVGCLVEALGSLAVAASVAMGLGLGLTAAVRRRGVPTVAARRVYIAVGYVVQAMNLAVFAWVIHGLGWPEFVKSGLGLRNAFVIDESMILLPFLLAEVAGWWGLLPAARASRMTSPSIRAGTYLIRKARLTFGMLLPVVVVFWAGNDLARILFAEAAGSPAVQVGVTACLGLVVLTISPGFVRLAWPTRPMESGPVRDRLERLAKRHGFHYTDILVWDTDYTIHNAVITGAFPWFRYVLLSDALVSQLDEHEIAAVFGHEMGHIRHRHLAFFGLFFFGSLGVIALLSQAVETIFAWMPFGRTSALLEIVKSLLLLGVIGVYYWFVFGALSRRFERQADVYGCRVVSCGRPLCPPHADYYARSSPPPAQSDILCPVGIRICVNALETVAAENGIRPDSPSWRHGSIGSRIEFLRSLDGRPSAERAFQSAVLRLRLLLLLMLASAFVLAILIGSFEALRIS